MSDGHGVPLPDPAVDLGFAPGDHLATAMLSPPVLGAVRTWNGASVLWLLPPGRELDWSDIGRGALARTEVEPGRYREVGLLSDRGALVLLDRHGTHLAMGLSSQDAQTLPLRPANELPGDASTAWHAFGSWLGAVAVDAARRGEVLLVERGGWPHQPEPYALFGILRSESGQATSHVEASPAPSTLQPPWAAAQRSGDVGVLGAPATLETVAAAGEVLASAVSTWASSPWDTCVTFAPNPDGPHAF